MGTLISLSIMLTGCGVQTHAISHPDKLIVSFRTTNQLPSLPRWIGSAGVSTVDEGFATGYILNAVQNIVVWQQGRWRFQVDGPFVVSSLIPGAHALYRRFETTTLPGHGVVTLRETHHAWIATVSYLTQSRHPHYEAASFPVTWTNTDLVKVMTSKLLNGPTTHQRSLACVVVLSIHKLQISDKILRCD